MAKNEAIFILDNDCKVKSESHCITLMRRTKGKNKEGEDVFRWNESYYSNFKQLLNALVGMEVQSVESIDKLWKTESRLRKMIQGLPDNLVTMRMKNGS